MTDEKDLARYGKTSTELNAEHKARLAQYYLDALYIQSASNLSGIVHSLSRAMDTIRLDAHNRAIAHEKHPICRLYLEQFCWLIAGGMGPDNEYSKAYDECILGAGDLIPDHMTSERERLANLRAERGL
jgi:hypothetical protein